MLSALEIARRAALKPVTKIAAEAGIPEDLLEPYGEYVAKVEPGLPSTNSPIVRRPGTSSSRPSPPLRSGEGKTTTTLGLGQAMRHIGKRATIAIRQASMGPTFGIKGGAAGGGYSQAVPFEALNLHLTGDMHAVTAAHNMLSAMLDNHLHQGNELGIDLHDVTWRRVLDVNDRALRNMVDRPRYRRGRSPAADRVRHHRRLRGDGGPGPVDVAAGHARRASGGSWSATPPAASR